MNVITMKCLKIRKAILNVVSCKVKRNGGKMKKYNKLVRDKIVDIIEADGRKAEYRILDNAEYKQELNKKLQEEVNEYLKDNNIEELADIIEVVYGIVDAMDASIGELENVREAKAKERGGFKKKIFLVEAEEKNNANI